jgi:hypothetical protein
MLEEYLQDLTITVLILGMCLLVWFKDGPKKRESSLADLKADKDLGWSLQSRPVSWNSDRASTPGYRDPGAFIDI